MRRLSVILSLLLLAPNRKKDLVLVYGLVFALFGSTPGLSQHGQSSNEVTVAQSRPADQPTQSGTPAQSTSGSDMLDRPTAHGRFGPERLSKGQLAKEVAAQKRVATYFHDKVTTRLKSCWDSLQRNGRYQDGVHLREAGQVLDARKGDSWPIRRCSTMSRTTLLSSAWRTPSRTHPSRSIPAMPTQKISSSRGLGRCPCSKTQNSSMKRCCARMAAVVAGGVTGAVLRRGAAAASARDHAPAA